VTTSRRRLCLPPALFRFGGRRLLIRNRKAAERIGGMAEPVMLWPETDVAVLVLALMIVTERIASGFGLFVVEPAARKDATSGFDPHHRCTGAGVLDRRRAFEAGLGPVIDIALAGDVVGRHTVVRQMDHCILPTATSQLGGVISQRLTNAFDVIEQPDLAIDELRNPNRHRVGAVPGAADIEDRPDRQHRIDWNVTDPAILPRLLQMSGEICTFESLGVVALPDVRIALGINFEIEAALLIEYAGEPRIVAPIRLNNDSVVRFLGSQEVIDGVALAARIPVCSELRALRPDGRAEQ
jgi:hypothetical protein